ncbi:MAG: oligosaccharide flippase family protein [Ignavibacteriales bacterium]|nr:oligosaccharide flippase family protein [Ignavibacteriales bacterium]
MEFGKHLKKGFWGLADKSLPLIYGLGFVLLVIRVLPKEEFGTYIIIQNLYLLLVAAGSSFALLPMVKFAAETEDIVAITNTGNWLYVFFVIVIGLPIVAFKEEFAKIFHTPDFIELAWFLPLMLVVSSLRQVTLYLLQSKIQIRHMFFLNAVYFIGSLILVIIVFQNVENQTAFTMLVINTVTLAFSSALGFLLLPSGTIRKMFLWNVQKVEVKKFWNYGKYSFGASSSYTLYLQADSFVIANLLGPVSVAVYNAAKVFIRIFDVVLQVIMMFIVPISAQLSSKNNVEDLRILAEKSIFVFTAIIFPMSIGLFFFSPEIISLFYNNKYSDTTILLRLLSLSGIFIPTIGVAASFLYGIGKMKEVFLVSAINVVTAICIMYFAIVYGGIVGAAVSIICISMMMMFTYYFALVKYCGISLRFSNIILRYKDALLFVQKLLNNKSN